MTPLNLPVDLPRQQRLASRGRGLAVDDAGAGEDFRRSRFDVGARAASPARPPASRRHRGAPSIDAKERWIFIIAVFHLAFVNRSSLS